MSRHQSQSAIRHAGVALLLFLLMIELQELHETPKILAKHPDTSTKYPLPKVFFAVYSGGSNNSQAVSKADARAGRAVNTLRETNRDTIVNTWADNNTFFVTSEQVNSPRIIRLAAHVEAGGYNGLIAKTEASWKYIYDHFVDEYDWFMKGDDDTYINIPRARYVLSHFDANVPTWLGRTTKLGFCHGGGGYILSRALLKAIGPHLGNCPQVPDQNTQWEDRFMQLCFVGKLDLGETRLWATCTSSDLLGFDPILANRKDQAFNAEVLYDLYKTQPLRLKAQASFHSVHATLARYLHKMFRLLEQNYPLSEPPIRLADLVDVAKANWENFAAFEVRDKTNFVSSWRCTLPQCNPQQTTAACPGPGGQAVATTAAICQDWQLKERPTLQEASGVQDVARVCGDELPSWRVVSSSCGGVHGEQTEDEPLSHRRPASSAAILVPVYRILTKEVIAALVFLVRSLRQSGSDADVIVFISGKLDLYDRIPGFVRENKGTAFVTHEKKWNGLTPSCDNIYGFCLYAAFLEAHTHFQHVVKASVDTFFQRDPFRAVDLRGGLAVFLSYPYSRELRWDAFGAWTYNATTMYSHDPEDGARCTGDGGCLHKRVGVLCQMFMGTRSSVLGFLIHTVALFESGPFYSNLRRSLHAVVRQGRVAMTHPVTLYPMDSGAVTCWTERCGNHRPVATLPPTLTVDGLGPVTGQAFRNDHGDLTAVVHGYSGVYGIDSRTFTLIRRPSADWERGLVPFRPTKPSAETPQHHPSPPASP